MRALKQDGFLPSGHFRPSPYARALPANQSGRFGPMEVDPEAKCQIPAHRHRRRGTLRACSGGREGSRAWPWRVSGCWSGLPCSTIERQQDWFWKADFIACDRQTDSEAFIAHVFDQIGQSRRKREDLAERRKVPTDWRTSCKASRVKPLASRLQSLPPEDCVGGRQ